MVGGGGGIVVGGGGGDVLGGGGGGSGDRSNVRRFEAKDGFEDDEKMAGAVGVCEPCRSWASKSERGPVGAFMGRRKEGSRTIALGARGMEADGREGISPSS